jgi:hypothetical protein
MAEREVIKLVTHQAKASSGVIATLENMAAAAKSEGFSGIAIAAVDRAGYTHTAFEGGENIAMLVGAVERVKHRLLNHQDEGNAS